MYIPPSIGSPLEASPIFDAIKSKVQIAANKSEFMQGNASTTSSVILNTLLKDFVSLDIRAVHLYSFAVFNDLLKSLVF